MTFPLPFAPLGSCAAGGSPPFGESHHSLTETECNQQLYRSRVSTLGKRAKLAPSHGEGHYFYCDFPRDLSREVLWRLQPQFRLFPGVKSAPMSAKTPSMNSWFVSTIRTRGAGAQKEVEWLLNECSTEQDAKELAAGALSRGLRVEAGTLPGIRPRVRIEWSAAHDWAQSSNPDAIRNLRRRLLVQMSLRASADRPPAAA